MMLAMCLLTNEKLDLIESHGLGVLVQDEVGEELHEERHDDGADVARDHTQQRQQTGDDRGDDDRPEQPGLEELAEFDLALGRAESPRERSAPGRSCPGWQWVSPDTTAPINVSQKPPELTRTTWPVTGSISVSALAPRMSTEDQLVDELDDSQAHEQDQDAQDPGSQVLLELLPAVVESITDAVGGRRHQRVWATAGHRAGGAHPDRRSPRAEAACHRPGAGGSGEGAGACSAAGDVVGAGGRRGGVAHDTFLWSGVRSN